MEIDAMATPGDMVRAVAEALGVPEPTVLAIDRKLAIAGLRTKGGRGPSAARMTPRDVATLLIAVAASDMVRDAPDVVKEYGRLQVRDESGVGDKTWPLDGVILPSLKKLQADHRFLDALAALVEAAADGTLNGLRDQEIRHWKENFGVSNALRELVRVEFIGPFPQAGVMISLPGAEEVSKPGQARHIRHRWEQKWYSRPILAYDDQGRIDTAGTDKLSKKYVAKYGHGHLKHRHEFGAPVIFAMGELLNR